MTFVANTTAPIIIEGKFKLLAESFKPLNDDSSKMKAIIISQYIDISIWSTFFWISLARLDREPKVWRIFKNSSEYVKSTQVPIRNWFYVAII